MIVRVVRLDDREAECVVEACPGEVTLRLEETQGTDGSLGVRGVAALTRGGEVREVLLDVAERASRRPRRFTATVNVPLTSRADEARASLVLRGQGAALYALVRETDEGEMFYEVGMGAARRRGVVLGRERPEERG